MEIDWGLEGCWVEVGCLERGLAGGGFAWRVLGGVGWLWRRAWPGVWGAGGGGVGWMGAVGWRVGCWLEGALAGGCFGGYWLDGGGWLWRLGLEGCWVEVISGCLKRWAA